MQDILLIDKPAGITSFDVIRRLRKKFKEENPSATLRVKIGHAGTLDPMATGLMIVGVGEGTKKLKDYLKLPKVYEAEVMLGVRTDTGDREGKILEKFLISNFEFLKENARKVLQGMVGKIILPVPLYSAVKRGGEPLYKKARRGEHFEPPLKTMEVKSVELLSHSPFPKGSTAEPGGISPSVSEIPRLPATPFKKGGIEGVLERRGLYDGDGIILKIRFEVTSGTYIRSLAEEIGRRLGVPATLWNLRRTRIGPPVGGFRIEDAEKLE